MNGILAFSLSNSVTEVGALAAFAALLGIAILSLLVFSQAREIKRLREWAGRAPERAAEMEQRVSADAAARLRGGAPPAPAGAPVRVVPRKTPLVSAPVSTAVNATVAAVLPGSGDSPALPAPASAAGPAPPVAGPVAAESPAAKGATGDAVAAAALLAGGSAALASESRGAEGSANRVNQSDGAEGSANRVNQSDGAAVQAASVHPPHVPGAKPADEGGDAQPADSGAVAPGGLTPAGPRDDRFAESSEQGSSPAPATAAARAVTASARAPLPPSPAAPAPPGPASSPELPAAAPAATAAGSMVAKSPARPQAPVAAGRPIPSRAVGASPAESIPPRSASPARSRADVPATSAGLRGAGRVSGTPGTSAGGPKYFKPERSPRRATALIVGGAIVGILVIVLAVSLLKGGGGGGTPSTHTTSTPARESPKTGSHNATSPVASNPAETAVVVLNGTGTPDLAHHLASDLQQSGYTLAAASTGVPPGTHATTVVEYASGHRADAKAVAKALNVTQVQAIESTIASLASSATVVVLAGADQASQLGGGGAQSGGEPAAGTGGEGTPAGQ